MPAARNLLAVLDHQYFDTHGGHAMPRSNDEHDDHPDEHYKIANQVEFFDVPSAIVWKPGQISHDTGELGFGSWTRRYDLPPVS